MLVTVDAYDELMMLLSRTWHLPSSICPMLTMLGQSLRIIHICQRLMLVVLALRLPRFCSALPATRTGRKHMLPTTPVWLPDACHYTDWPVAILLQHPWWTARAYQMPTPRYSKIFKKSSKFAQTYIAVRKRSLENTKFRKESQT